MVKPWLLTLAFVLLAVPPAWADAQSVVVKKILQTRTTAAGQPLKVPQNPELIVTTYEIAPNTTLPLHKHPYARYAYVLAGEITVHAGEGRRFHYKTGDVIVEVIDQWHTGTTGASPVKLLVFDQVPAGTPSTVLWENSDKH
jgi:quercetin dioxygenase-like cupin family protein